MATKRNKMSASFKKCRIVTDTTTRMKYLYFIENGREMPVSHDGLIPLPADFKITLYVEPIVKQLKKLGYKVKGNRFLSQTTGEVETELFICI